MPLRELLTRIEKFKGDKNDYIGTIVVNDLYIYVWMLYSPRPQWRFSGANTNKLQTNNMNEQSVL